MWLLAISVWGAPRQATASEAYQQRRERISVSFRNASLAEVLQRIKQQTGYYILYNSDAVRGIGGISFSKADAPVREVLDEALRGTRLEYSIDDDTIVIRGRSGGGERLRPAESPGQGRQRTCDGHGRRAARGREHPDPGDRHGSRVGVRRRILDPHARGPRQPDLLPHRLRLANASLGTDQTGQAGAGRTGDRKRRGDRHLHPQEGELHGFGHDHHVGPAGPRE